MQAHGESLVRCRLCTACQDFLHSSRKSVLTIRSSYLLSPKIHTVLSRALGRRSFFTRSGNDAASRSVLPEPTAESLPQSPDKHSQHDEPYAQRVGTLSKTSLTPLCVSAEHSRYLTAPSSRASWWPAFDCTYTRCFSRGSSFPLAC
jgi:hypothetical protein